MHRAVWRSDPEVVRLLLDAGADVTARNEEGQAPLIRYASNMNGTPSRYTVPGGPEPDVRVEVFQMLIDRSADIYAVDAKKRTSLHALTLCRINETRAPIIAQAAKDLIEAGLKVEAMDVDGRTALDILRNNKNDEVIKQLCRCCVPFLDSSGVQSERSK